eukprot:4038175-Pyramimonas_sp.AAC.1
MYIHPYRDRQRQTETDRDRQRQRGRRGAHLVAGASGLYDLVAQDHVQATGQAARRDLPSKNDEFSHRYGEFSHRYGEFSH